jgi:hypothetical protein
LVEVDPEDLILNCYRLADRYHQNPEVFLQMPFSRLNAHIYYTIKLIDAQRRAARRRDDDE